MKRNLLSVILIVSIIVTLLGCGNKNDQVDPTKLFVDCVQTVCAENSELASYSMGDLIDQGNGLYGTNAFIDGKNIGAVSVNVIGEEVTEFTFSFSASGPSEKEYRQPIIASAMTMDSTLDYSTAKDIASDLSLELVFGGSPIKTINGLTYSAEWREDDLIFVRIVK